MRSGEAWLTVCWTGDGKQLHTDMPEIEYVLGTEGGELWSDFYAVPKGAPHRAAGYALIDYLVTPAVNAKEVLFHGYPSADSRSEEHTSELQSLMRTSYAVFFLTKKIRLILESHCHTDTP